MTHQGHEWAPGGRKESSPWHLHQMAGVPRAVRAQGAWLSSGVSLHVSSRCSFLASSFHLYLSPTRKMFTVSYLLGIHTMKTRKGPGGPRMGCGEEPHSEWWSGCWPVGSIFLLTQISTIEPSLNHCCRHIVSLNKVCRRKDGSKEGRKKGRREGSEGGRKWTGSWFWGGL